MSKYQGDNNRIQKLCLNQIIYVYIFMSITYLKEKSGSKFMLRVLGPHKGLSIFVKNHISNQLRIILRNIQINPTQKKTRLSWLKELTKKIHSRKKKY